MKIHYVTGSRADFCLMQSCLQVLNSDADLDVELVVTGQHLMAQYGDTREDVAMSGLQIIGEVPVTLSGNDGAEMAIALAEELNGFVNLWRNDPPDFVLLLGDRGEMLAAALAAVHLGIHTGHLHGGERSGTLDESFRHAISKLVHIHFPATRESATRLERMGEDPNQIYVVGAPGLVGMDNGIVSNSNALKRRYGFQLKRNVALVIFHPVVQQASLAFEQIKTLVEVLTEQGLSQLILRPNSDAGGKQIDAFLDQVTISDEIAVCKHLSRNDFLSTLASCDIMIGNSSSGIIESATFGVPCINIGLRQNLRERNPNVIDCNLITRIELTEAIHKAKNLAGPYENRFGNGQTDEYLRDVLKNLKLDKSLLMKSNAF